MKNNNYIVLGAAILMGLAVSAKATVIDLDLSSGVNSIQNGAPFSADTYTEAGFTIQMDRAGDHFDPGFIGDLGFHNGPANPDNVSWTLSFGGNAFSLLGVDVAGFESSALSFTVTGSNSVFNIINATGFSSVTGLTNVTSVTFNIDQDGGVESVGLSGLRVDNAPAVPDAGSSVGLLGLGLMVLAISRKKLV